jgi:hypothetical protein
MLVSLVSEMTDEISLEKTLIVTRLSDQMKNYFNSKNYGAGIDTCFIAVICVSPKFDSFCVIRKPKYSKASKTYFGRDGKEINYGSTFSFDIKLDFQSFLNGNETECLKILAKEILHSLIVFEQVRRRIKQFDSTKFQSDLELFFKDKSLI